MQHLVDKRDSIPKRAIGPNVVRKPFNPYRFRNAAMEYEIEGAGPIKIGVKFTVNGNLPRVVGDPKTRAPYEKEIVFPILFENGWCTIPDTEGVHEEVIKYREWCENRGYSAEDIEYMTWIEKTGLSAATHMGAKYSAKSLAGKIVGTWISCEYLVDNYVDGDLQNSGWEGFYSSDGEAYIHLSMAYEYLRNPDRRNVYDAMKLPRKNCFYDSVQKLYRMIAEICPDYKTNPNFRRWREALYGFHQAQLWIVMDRIRNVPPQDPLIMEYRRMHSSGTGATFDMVMLVGGIRLNEEIYKGIIFRRLYISASLLVSYCNDLVSLEREIMGTIGQNIVVAYIARGYTIDEAVDRVLDKSYNEVAIFNNLAENLRIRFGSDVEHAIYALRELVDCTTHWYRYTDRYNSGYSGLVPLKDHPMHIKYLQDGSKPSHQV